MIYLYQPERLSEATRQKSHVITRMHIDLSKVSVIDEQSYGLLIYVELIDKPIYVPHYFVPELEAANKQLLNTWKELRK